MSCPPSRVTMAPPLVPDASLHAAHVELRARLVRAVQQACPPDIADMAEDIAHVALVRMVESYRGDQPPSEAYLRRIAHNGVIDEVRRRARERKARAEARVSSDGATQAQGDAVERRQLGDAIRKCVSGLSRNRRVAVILHLLGLDNAAIASRMRWDGRQVRNNLHRGMLGLRTCLSDKGHAP